MSVHCHSDANNASIKSRRITHNQLIYQDVIRDVVTRLSTDMFYPIFNTGLVLAVLSTKISKEGQ